MVFLSFKADVDTDKFLENNHSFDDYAREVKRYLKLVDEITYKSEKVCLTIIIGFKYFSFEISLHVAKAEVC